MFKKLNIDPKNCLVIEDSVFGIRAAKKAQMHCIGVPLGDYSNRELEKEQADLTVNSLMDKNQILNFIFNV